MFLVKHQNGIYYLRYKLSSGKYTQISCKTNSKRLAEKFKEQFLQNPHKEQYNLLTSDIFRVFEVDKSYISKRFLQIIGDFPVKALEHGHISVYINERKNDMFRGRKISPITVNDDLIFLKRIFNKAIQYEYMTKNPVKGVKFLPTPTNKKRQIFNNDEIKQLLDSLNYYPSYQNLIKFAFYTGCRIGEVVNLEWSDIEDTKIKIGVKVNDLNEYTFMTKNRSERVIYMSKEMINFLKSIPNTANYIFVDKNNQKFNIGHVSKLFKKHIRKLNLSDNLHFHSIRHTFITNLINNGHSIYNVQQFMGHKYYETTLKYSHPLDENMKAISESVSLKKN